MERKNRKGDSTIFYPNLTMNISEKRGKAPLVLVKKVMFNKSNNMVNIFISSV